MKMTRDDFVAILEEATKAGAEAVKGMNDGYPCGGAYVIADGRSQLVQGFKKWGYENDGKYSLGDWKMLKNYPTGFMLINTRNGGYQNMQMHTAENNAYQTVFGMFNIVTSVHTYID